MASPVKSRFRNLVPGAFLVLVFFGAAVLSYFWTPFDVESLDIKNRMHTPNATNWLGTDHLGRDIFSMLMVGARTSIAVAFIAVGIGLLFGVPLGLMAASYKGDWFDELIMRGNDLVFAFPSLLRCLPD